MIQPRSIVKIADNTGAKIGRIFKVLGSSKKRYAQIGDIVVLSVQKAEPRKAVKKKDVCRQLSFDSASHSAERTVHTSVSMKMQW
jgi:large subunit ribosomal protein L14